MRNTCLLLLLLRFAARVAADVYIDDHHYTTTAAAAATNTNWPPFSTVVDITERDYAAYAAAAQPPVAAAAAEEALLRDLLCNAVLEERTGSPWRNVSLSAILAAVRRRGDEQLSPRRLAVNTEALYDAAFGGASERAAATTDYGRELQPAMATPCLYYDSGETLYVETYGKLTLSIALFPNIESIHLPALLNIADGGDYPPYYAHWLPLEGSLPSELGRLRQLRYLNLSRQFTDTFGAFREPLSLPRELSLTSLTTLDLTGVIALQNSILNPLFLPRTVEELWLSRSRIGGALGDAFGERFSNLRVFSCQWCNLEGTLAPSFGKLANLSYLDLGHNHFFQYTTLVRGLRWAAPRNFTRLQILQYNGEQTFPAAASASLQALEALALNNLGMPTLPAGFIANLRALRSLNLDHNNITRLGDEGDRALAQLTRLERFAMRHNALADFPFAGAAAWRALRALRLSHNAFSSDVRLEHVLQHLLPAAHSLEELDLSHCGLAGTVPAFMAAAFTRLQVLNLRNNRLSGTLPTNLDQLSQLRELRIASNELIMDLPPLPTASLVVCELVDGPPTIEDNAVLAGGSGEHNCFSCSEYYTDYEEPNPCGIKKWSLNPCGKGQYSTCHEFIDKIKLNRRLDSTLSTVGIVGLLIIFAFMTCFFVLQKYPELRGNRRAGRNRHNGNRRVNDGHNLRQDNVNINDNSNDGDESDSTTSSEGGNSDTAVNHFHTYNANNTDDNINNVSGTLEQNASSDEREDVEIQRHRGKRKKRRGGASASAAAAARRRTSNTHIEMHQLNL